MTKFELRKRTKKFHVDVIKYLIKEANELVSIFNAADITAKKNRDQSNPQINKSQNQQ